MVSLAYSYIVMNYGLSFGCTLSWNCLVLESLDEISLREWERVERGAVRRRREGGRKGTDRPIRN